MIARLRKEEGPPIMTDQILIKRYARSRLYEATQARYVSLEELQQWRRDGVPFCGS